MTGRAESEGELGLFRDTVRRLFTRELLPNLDRYEKEGIVDRAFWRACGAGGLLCPTVAEEYGGAGLDFRYNAVVLEELAYAGSSAGLPVQNDIVAEYVSRYGTEAQKSRYLPGMVQGDTIAAIALTEPGTGSDLQAVQTTAVPRGDGYVINGAKTYITNGQNCDICIVLARTAPRDRARGLSLFIVEAGTPGFAKGRNLDKIGHRSNDTSELFFADVHVPATALLGREGEGFFHLMELLPQERLSIAVSAQAGAQRAFDEAVRFTRERKAFGKPIFAFQNSRFTLAGLKAQLQAGWAHIDWCLARHVAGKLTTEEASAAKLWHTEMQWQVCDAALQLHGGAGYMNEYAIARLWRDARVGRIFGGTNEIMKEVISRAI